MDYRQAIQESIDYMEDNLTAEIAAAELARRAGFSLYHFCRLFHSAVGMPVGQYLTRRRLLHAAFAIARGNSGIDAALRCGFDTYAGFYRAFKREFSCTIAEFLAAGRGKQPCRVNILQEAHKMVTKKRAAVLLTHWGLEQAEIQDIYYENGARNENAYYVGSDLVLKFTENLSKVKNHCTLSRALEAAGLLSALPVQTRNGGEYVDDGELYFYLIRRLPGNQMAAREVFAPGRANLLGRLIGQLHQALAQVDPVVEDADLLETVESWALPQAKAVLGLPERFWQDFREKFTELYPQLPRQVIHRDPNPGNIIGSGETWGFIDFELSQRNARLYDPCYAATAVLSELGAEHWASWPEIYREILLGYDSTAHLTVEERAAAPYIVLANQLVCVAWFAGQEKYAELLRVNVAMTRFLVENWERLRLER